MKLELRRLREAAASSASPAIVRADDHSDEPGTGVDDREEMAEDSDSTSDSKDTKTCPTCKGSGKILGGNVTCKTCKGTGKVPADYKPPAAGDSKPPWLKEGATVEERLASLEEALAATADLRESRPDFLNREFSPMTRVTNSHGQQGYAVTLIREGKGNQEDDNWYTAAAIKEMVESGRAEGMQAYANHPDLEEEEIRPERDVRQLIGTHTDVSFAEANGKAIAKAIFVPITTNEMHPTYGWVTTLAEAAVHNQGPQPLVGWSLYGMSGGDEGDRPDGSEGRLVNLIMPSSGDMVTNAGAGGEFARRLMMESARRLRRATPTTPKGESMKVDEFNTKFAEATTHLREADTDEKRTAAQAEFDALAEAKVDAPAKTPDSVDALQEAAPGLVERIREAATKEISTEKDDVAKQLKETQDALKEAQSTLGQFTDVMSIDGILRENKVTDEKERRYFIAQARSRGLREADDIKDLVETEREYQAGQKAQILESLRESLDLPEVEGVPGRLPEPVADGGVATLREAGIPIKDAA